MTYPEVQTEPHMVDPASNFLQSSSMLLVVQAALSGLSLLNYFVLATHLSPGELGAWLTLLALSASLVMLISLGYHKASIYFVGGKLFPLETVFMNGLGIVSLYTLLFAVIAYGGRSYLQPLFPEIPFSEVFLTLLCTPTYLLLIYISEATLAAHLLRVTFLTKTLAPLIYIGGCFTLAMWGKLDLHSVTLMFFGGVVATVLSSSFYLFVLSSRRSDFVFDRHALWQCLRFGGKAQIGNLSQYMSNRIDMLMVAYWAGVGAVAYYAIAVRLAELIWNFSNPIELALSTIFAQMSQTGSLDQYIQRVVKYVGLVVGSLAAGVVFFSIVFIPVFLPQYIPSILLVLILLPGTIAITMFQAIIGILLGNGQPALATKLQLVLLSLSLLLYLGLIPGYGGLGASVGTTLSYVVACLTAILVVSRVYHYGWRDYFIWDNVDTSFVQEMSKRLNQVWRRLRPRKA